MPTPRSVSALLLCALVGLSACNKDKSLKRRLDGTWDIVNYTCTDPEEGVTASTGI